MKNGALYTTFATVLTLSNISEAPKCDFATSSMSSTEVRTEIVQRGWGIYATKPSPQTGQFPDEYKWHNSWVSKHLDILKTKYQISQQNERQIEGLSLYLSKLSGFMTTDMKVYYDEDDDKVSFSLRLKENVTVDISHFMDETDRKLVVFAIHKNRHLLVADEDRIDALVDNLINALS